MSYINVVDEGKIIETTKQCPASQFCLPRELKTILIKRLKCCSTETNFVSSTQDLEINVKFRIFIKVGKKLSTYKKVANKFSTLENANNLTRLKSCK